MWGSYSLRDSYTGGEVGKLLWQLTTQDLLEAGLGLGLGKSRGTVSSSPAPNVASSRSCACVAVL